MKTVSGIEHSLAKIC